MFAKQAMSFSTNGSIHFDCGPNMATDPNNPNGPNIPNSNSEFIVNAQKIILGFKMEQDQEEQDQTVKEIQVKKINQHY